MRYSATRVHGQSGFSLVELMVVIFLMAIVGGLTAYGIGAAMPTIRSQGGAVRVISELRNAREWALAQRRTVEVRFLGTNQLQIVRRDLPSGETTLTDVFLENGIQYVMFPYVPDTPDAFGRGQSVDFGPGATSTTFISDGTLVDQTGTPVNGTIFVGIPNDPLSARAVTVLGGTGRVHDYRWDGSRWVDRS